MVVKSFGTVLNDHPSVFRSSSSLKTSFVPDVEVPPVFRGEYVWKEYISRIVNQGKCGNCWAAATTTALADRFGIMTLGQNIYRFSSYQLTVCESILSEKPPTDPNVLSQIHLAAHSTKACYGNTIVNALKHLYVYGVLNYECFSNSKKALSGIKNLKSYEKVGDLPKCNELLGNDYDTCSDGITAARFFRCINYYSINSNIDEIKKDIYKFGSVISGFILYDDFINEYDGKTIYMGPKSNSKPQGGHAIRIVGWDKEGDVEYWIIANSWGSSWGLDGYFKMKMGIPQCQLEDNVYGLIPDIPTINIMGIPLHVDNQSILERNKIQIDVRTGYKLSAIKKIQKRLLQGSYRELYNPDYMPDFSKFIAGRVFKYTKLYTNFPISPYFKDLVGKTNKYQAFIDDWTYYITVLLVSVLITILLLKKYRK